MKNALLQWIDERTGLRGLMDGCSRENVLGGVSWGNSVRAALLFLFIVQALTGFFLWAYYSPSAQTAWESVYYIQHELPGGWLVRGIHHYAAQVMVGLAALYVLGMIVLGECRSPRELVYWSAMLIGMFALGLCLTGDLLSWDKNAYSATMVRVRFLTLLPWAGGALFKLAAGGPGPGFGTHTLTRFFALHVGVLGAGLFGLILLHLWLARRAKVAERRPPLPAGPYWPDQAARNAAACALVMAAVLALVLWEGVGLGAPGDQADFFAGARPEWSLRGVYGLSEMFPGSVKILPIFIIPGGLVLLFALLPFVGRLTAGYIVNLGVVAVVAGGLGVLTVHSYWKDAGDQKHQEALVQGREEARRAVELAQGQGIPAAGALTLLKADPKSEGARLFEQHCAACHEHVGGAGREFALEKPTAPNLGAFASRDSVAGFLDPKRIRSPQYFGNTKFRAGEMAVFIKDQFEDLDEEETQELREEMAKIAAALSAEAKLESQVALDAAEADRIAQGRELIGTSGCRDCHVYRGKGTRNGPDLDGYGSLEWMTAIIGNPAHKRFYGERDGEIRNDRMPVYEKELSRGQIELLARFIRGEWYEPEALAAEGGE